MLKLKMATDPRWVNIAGKNLAEILTDHAYCEQKAASAAISIIVRFPEYSDIVEAMSELAREEMEHFQRVHAHIRKRGLVLGRERKDPYVADLRLFFENRSGDKRHQLVNALLMAAMIEARSCERFRLLSQGVPDAELAGFYDELMQSEAGHYALFIGLARKHGPSEAEVNKLWDAFLTYEAKVMAGYGNREMIHG